ncbi:MAG: hypothetical protein ACK40X_09715 [Armatimonadota bacterium]
MNVTGENDPSGIEPNATVNLINFCQPSIFAASGFVPTNGARDAGLELVWKVGKLKSPQVGGWANRQVW